MKKRLLILFNAIVLILAFTGNIQAQPTPSICEIVLTQPNQLKAEISGDDTLCFSGSAVISVKISGGVQPWTILHPGLTTPVKISDTDGTDDSTFIYTFNTGVLTSTTTYDSTNITVMDSLGCDVLYNSSAVVTISTLNLNFTAENVYVCSGQKADISLSGSEVGVSYYLSNAYTYYNSDTIIGNGSSITFTDIPVGSYYKIIATNAIGCSDELNDIVSVIAEPAPMLTIGGNIVCSGTTYSIEFISNSDSISVSAGTVSGNTIIDIPIAQDVIVTAISDHGCETSLTYNAPTGGCPTNCVFPDLVVGNPICYSNNSVYYVPFSETTGATINVTGGTIEGNVIKGTTGTDIIVESSNGTCVSKITVKSPICSDDCSQVLLSIVKPICSSDNQFYSVEFITYYSYVTSNYGIVTINDENLYSGVVTNIPKGTEVTLIATITGCSPQRIRITAPICQSHPIAIDDINSTVQDIPVSGDVTTNDVLSIDGGNVWSLVTPPSVGDLTFNSDGTYVYQPELGFSGIVTFTYQLCDINNNCDTAVVQINVVPNVAPATNVPPVATNDAVSGNINTDITGNVLPNDYDPNGDSIIVNTTPIQDVTNGVLVLNADGTFTYTPNPGFVGNDSFTYEICDDATPSLCSQAVVYITVVDNQGANTTYASDDNYNIPYNVINYSGNVSLNDYDPEGNATTVGTTPVSSVSNGTLVLNADGTFTYTPNPGYFGPDSFIYSVCDDGTPAACDTATVYLTINPNNPPIIEEPGNQTTPEDTPIEICTTVSDVDGVALTETLCAGSPSHGTVTTTLTNDSLLCMTYTPDLNYFGLDTICVIVCDSAGLCDTAHIAIEVTPVNDPPVIEDTDDQTTPEDTPIEICTTVSDVDGVALTETLCAGSPSHGTVTTTLTNDSLLCMTYTPDLNYFGLDTICIIVCDSAGLCDTAHIAIEVTPINDPPVVFNEYINICSTTEYEGTLINGDYDIEGDNLIYGNILVNGTYGTMTIVDSTTGTFYYKVDSVLLTTVYDTVVVEVCDTDALLPRECSNDTLFVEITPSAVINVGADTIICQGSNYHISGVVATNAYDLIWTTTGDGSFNNWNVLNPIYTPGHEDIMNGGVDLILSGEGTAPCGISSDTLHLTISLKPIADAGEDATICEGTVYQIVGAQAIPSHGISWTSNGDGTFSDTLAVNPTYTAGPLDVLNGEVTLTITVQGGSPCSPASDAMLLTINRNSIVYAGVDTTICEVNNYQITDATADGTTGIIWTTTGDGSFNNWNLLNPVYTPGNNDKLNGGVDLILTGTSVSPCGNSADTMHLTISLQPIADAGEDATICEGTVYQIVGAQALPSDGAIWSTSGDGTFSDTLAVNPTYTAGPLDVLNGQVTLTITVEGASPCSPAVDSMTLTISKNAIVYAGLDTTICEVNNYQITDATAVETTSIIWTTTGDGSFNNWNLLNPIYTPGNNDKLNGGVDLILTGTSVSPCGNSADTMHLTISLQPIADAGEDATICEGTVYQIVGAQAIPNDGVIWSTSGDGTFSDTLAVNPTYTAGPTDILNGQVTLTITVEGASPCSPAVDSMTLTISKNAIVYAGVDTTICEVNNYQITDATAIETTSIQWTTTGDGSFNNWNVLNPIYTPGNNDKLNGGVDLILTGTSVAPCGNSVDTMHLTISLQPIADAGEDATICEGTVYQIEGAQAIPSDGVIWSTSGDGTFSDTLAVNPTYTAGPTDILNGQVTLTITVEGASPCSPAVDSMTLTIIRSAVVNAGIDATICEGSNYHITGAVATNVNSIIWTTSGDGSFNNWNVLNPVYTPGSEDILNGSVNLILNGYGIAPCGNTSDTLVLTIDPQAVVNAGVDTNICENNTLQITTSSATNYNSLVWSTSGDGTFSDNSILNPIYTPGNNDIQIGIVTLTLTATGTATCSAEVVSDNMTLYVYKAPIAVAGPDAIICQGESYTVSDAFALNYSSITWTHNGLGTITGANTLTPTYNPGIDEVGIITLTMTLAGNGGCDSVSSQKELTIYGVPVVNAGPDGSTCELVSYALSAATAANYSSIFWTTTGSGVFSDPTSINTTYTPSSGDAALGTVTLTVTAEGLGTCDPVQDQMILTVTKAPTVSIPNNGSICEGESFTMTGATATNYASVSWSHNGTGVLTNPNTLTPTYTPGIGEVGEVTLTITVFGNGTCGQITDECVLTIYSNPVVSAGDDQEICGAEIVNIEGTATNYTSVLWTTSGNGVFGNPSNLATTYTPSYSDILNGSAHLVLTAYNNPSCPGISDTLTITISTPAVANAGSDAVICSGSSYTVNDASVEGSSNYIWSHDGTGVLVGENTLNPTYTTGANESGVVTLTLTVTGTPPCSNASDEMQITIVPAAVVNAGDDINSCQDVNGSIIPIAIPTASAANYSNIVWSTSGTGTFDNANVVNPIYTPSIADINIGQITLTMFVEGNGPCSDASDIMLITFSKTPTVNAGSNQTICQGSPYTVDEATANNYSSLSWEISPVEAGTIADANTLTPTFVPNSTFTGTVTMTLNVQGEGACSSTTVSSSFEINVIPGLTVNAGIDQLVTLAQTTQLQGLVEGGSGFYSISWTPTSEVDNGTILNPFTKPILHNTTFTLSALDLQTGCMGSDNVTIYVDTLNLAPVAVDDYDTTFVEIPITVNVLGNDYDPDGDPLTVTICGDPLHGTVLVNEDNTITYTPNAGYIGDDSFCYTICDDGNPALCSSATVYIHIEDLVIYNIVTNNSDGNNDTWFIKGIEFYPDNHILIFNRWGDRINEFEEYDNVNVVWDGTNVNGDRIPDGTYFYVIDIKNRGKYSGWVYVKSGLK